jgi:hypothetical protein
MARFNVLLREMNSSLAEMKKAIKGITTMTPTLDIMY